MFGFELRSQFVGGKVFDFGLARRGMGSQTGGLSCLMLAVCLAMAPFHSAIAQTTSAGDVSPSVLRQQADIVQRSEARRRAEQEAARRRTNPVGGARAGVASLPEGDGPCVEINRIELVGANLLSPAKAAALLAPFEGRCLKGSGLQNVIRVLTNWYVEQGYITSRAYLGPQDLSARVLKVTVVEGRQSSSTVLDNGEERRTGRINSLADLDGKIANLRIIEQRLDQINRLPSHDAKIAIEPGDDVGTSRIVVNTSVKDRMRLRVGLDNNGAASTGEWQSSASFSAHDMFGFYEALSLSWNGAVQDELLGLSPAQEGSRSLSANLEVPYGAWTGRVSVSWFDYATLLTGVNQTFSNEGNTWNFSAEGERLLHRDQVSKTWALAGLRVKDTDTFIEDILVQTASRRLSIGHVALGHSHAVLGGIFEVTGGVRKGLNILGAKKDGVLDFEGQDPGPKAQFISGYIDASYDKPFQLGEQAFLWRSTINAAVSNDLLFGSERLAAGGLYSVRGYRAHSISGDTGIISRNELSWSLPLFDKGESAAMAQAKRIFGTPQLFAAIDGATIARDGGDEFEGGRIAGGAVGLRLTGGILSLDASWEEPLSHPSWFNDDENGSGPEGLFAFKMGVNLAF